MELLFREGGRGERRIQGETRLGRFFGRRFRAAAAAFANVGPGCAARRLRHDRGRAHADRKSTPVAVRRRAAVAGESGQAGGAKGEGAKTTHLTARARAADDLHDDGELGGLVLWVAKGVGGGRRGGGAGRREGSADDRERARARAAAAAATALHHSDRESLSLCLPCDHGRRGARAAIGTCEGIAVARLGGPGRRRDQQKGREREGRGASGGVVLPPSCLHCARAGAHTRGSRARGKRTILARERSTGSFVWFKKGLRKEEEDGSVGEGGRGFSFPPSLLPPPSSPPLLPLPPLPLSLDAQASPHNTTTRETRALSSAAPSTHTSTSDSKQSTARSHLERTWQRTGTRRGEPSKTDPARPRPSQGPPLDRVRAAQRQQQHRHSTFHARQQPKPDPRLLARGRQPLDHAAGRRRRPAARRRRRARSTTAG